MSKEVRTIGIVGTGIIATSMAVLTTGHGFKTVVYARSEASILEERSSTILKGSTLK